MGNSKVVVLYSGGLDSTTLLYQAVFMFGAANVVALNMFYGQRHQREIQCAEFNCDKLGVEFIQHDVSSAFEFSNSSMLAKGNDLARGNYDEQLKSADAKNERGQLDTFVPFRNGLFLSCATAVAYSIGANIVAYGAHKDDAAGEAYPDCSKEFVDKMNDAITSGTGSNVKVWAPYIEMNKAEIVNLGIQLKVPYQMTWSCYDNQPYVCGTCGTCIDREKAFTLNGCVDPLVAAKRAIESIKETAGMLL